jgi:signal transduction histidine kinase
MNANSDIAANVTPDTLAKQLLENLHTIGKKILTADSIAAASQELLDALWWRTPLTIAPCVLDSIFFVALDSSGGALGFTDYRVTPDAAQFATNFVSFNEMLLKLLFVGDLVNFTKDSHPELSALTSMESGTIVPISHMGTLYGGLGYGNRNPVNYQPILSIATKMLADQAGATLARLAAEQRTKYQIGFLQTERDLFESILESTTDAILMVDHRTRTVLTANLQFETFFRLPRYQIIKQDMDSVSTIINARGDFPPELGNILLTFSNNEHDSAAGDFEVLTPQRRTLVWYSSPVHAPDFQLIGRLFVFRDATAEREVDRTKNEFVSLVSHELRTPLSAIIGFTDLMIDGSLGEISHNILENIFIIRQNAERLIRVINDILDLTRLEAGRLDLRQDFHQLGSMIDSVHLMIHPMLLEHDQSVTISLERDLPPVWVDRDRIIQVFTNLLSNASKYSGDGATIFVEARLITPNDLPIPGRNKPIVRPEVLIGVHDNGMGITQNEQEKLFTRFFRTEQVTKSQIAGTGLGLTIVKSFVELHGGEVWVYSEPGRGASFYFTLPVLDDSLNMETQGK